MEQKREDLECALIVFIYQLKISDETTHPSPLFTHGSYSTSGSRSTFDDCHRRPREARFSMPPNTNHAPAPNILPRLIPSSSAISLSRPLVIRMVTRCVLETWSPTSSRLAYDLPNVGNLHSPSRSDQNQPECSMIAKCPCSASYWNRPWMKAKQKRSDAGRGLRARAYQNSPKVI